MRRPNRNIEIFSMSVLDLFASALGGFILIAVILFPNYMKEQRVVVELEASKDKLKQTEARLDGAETRLRVIELEKRQQEVSLVQCQASQNQLQQALSAREQQLQQASAQLQQASAQLQRSSTLRQQLASCEAALANTFIVVSIDWASAGNFDVDLHVTDPEGHEFYWNKHNRARRDYPTSEAQLSYDNTKGPGVELWQEPRAKAGTYKVSYSYLNQSPVEVKGNVFYRNGRAELPAASLTGSNSSRHVADIIVGQTGDVQVRPR